MRIESLSLFLLVIEKGCISKAARQVYISQQGASSVIKNLEHDFGVALFDRRGNDLILTESGKRIAHEAEQVVSAYRRLQTIAALGKANGSVSDVPLRVITTPYTLHTFTPIFDAYNEALGATNALEFIEKSLFEIIREYPDLDDDAVYMINIPSFMTHISQNIGSSFKPLVTSDLMLFCRSDADYAKNKVIAKPNLKGAQIACYKEELLKRLIRNLIKDIADAEIRVQTTSLALLTKAIIEQGFVSFTDSFSVFLGGSPPTNEATVVPIIDSTKLTTGILGKSHNQQAIGFTSFLEGYFSIICADYMNRFPIIGFPVDHEQIMVTS